MGVFYKSEAKTPKRITYEVPREVLEREFIFNFLKELPFENLKKLVEFEEFDYEDRELWDNALDDSPLYTLLCHLRNERVVLFRAKLHINTD